MGPYPQKKTKVTPGLSLLDFPLVHKLQVFTFLSQSMWHFFQDLYAEYTEYGPTCQGFIQWCSALHTLQIRMGRRHIRCAS